MNTSKQQKETLLGWSSIGNHHICIHRIYVYTYIYLCAIGYSTSILFCSFFHTCLKFNTVAQQEIHRFSLTDTIAVEEAIYFPLKHPEIFGKGWIILSYKKHNFLLFIILISILSYRKHNFLLFIIFISFCRLVWNNS